MTMILISSFLRFCSNLFFFFPLNYFSFLLLVPGPLFSSLALLRTSREPLENKTKQIRHPKPPTISMENLCQPCHKLFATSASLLRHQRNAKSCLGRQVGGVEDNKKKTG